MTWYPWLKAEIVNGKDRKDEEENKEKVEKQDGNVHILNDKRRNILPKEGC